MTLWVESSWSGALGSPLSWGVKVVAKRLTSPSGFLALNPGSGRSAGSPIGRMQSGTGTCLLTPTPGALAPREETLQAESRGDLRNLLHNRPPLSLARGRVVSLPQLSDLFAPNPAPPQFLGSLDRHVTFPIEISLGPRALHGFARSHGSGDLFQLSGSYIEDVSVDRNGLGNQRMVANAPHVGDNTGRIILHREPINELTFCRSGTLSDIAKAGGSELRGLEATGKEVPHHLVGEEQHAAVGVVNDEKLTRAEELIGDDQGAERVIAGAPSGVANDVGISLRQASVLGRIETGVHAREFRKVTRGW